MGTTFTAFVQTIGYTRGLGEWYDDIAVVDLGKAYEFVRDLEEREVIRGIPVYAGPFIWDFQKRRDDIDECWFSCNGSLALEVIDELETTKSWGNDYSTSIYVRALRAVLREVLPYHAVRLTMHTCG